LAGKKEFQKKVRKKRERQREILGTNRACGHPEPCVQPHSFLVGWAVAKAASGGVSSLPSLSSMGDGGFHHHGVVGVASPPPDNKDTPAGPCYGGMNFDFSLTLGNDTYAVGLSNLIMAMSLFIGSLFMFVMTLRSFATVRRAMWSGSVPSLRSQYGLMPMAYFVYLFMVCFWLALEGLNLLLVATAGIFPFAGRIFFIGHAFFDTGVVFLLYFKKPTTCAAVTSIILATLVAAAKAAALLFVYGVENPCGSCPVFFPSRKAFYGDLVFAVSYGFLIYIQLAAGFVLRRAKNKVLSHQGFTIFDMHMVQFCRKIKARRSLLLWLVFLFFVYCGSSIASGIILYTDADYGYCVMHVIIYIYVVPYCFLLWVVLCRDSEYLYRLKLQQNQQDNKKLDNGSVNIEHFRLTTENADSHDRINTKDSEQGDADVLGDYDTESFQFPSSVRLAVSFHEEESNRGNQDEKPPAGTKKKRTTRNQDLRQILRESTVPIRLVASRRVRFNRKIGVGGYGEVYQAEWGGTEVAVKRFVSDQPEINFLNEVEVISRLHHPNVVAFIGVIVEPSYQCLITEFVPLGNVFQWLHNPKAEVPPEKKKKIALDTARGMLYLHSRSPPIIHRDLKPMNLLVAQDWTIKICDFGLSRPKLQTETMSRTGTVQWVAPEILRELPYNEKCDVFSYGVVLWELYTQLIPWNKIGTFQVANDVAFRGRRLELPQDCPTKLAKLIESCWDADPDVRPPFSEIIGTIEEMDESVWGPKE